MAFRFDMKNKTSQQQIIVAKRDEEGRRRIEDATRKGVGNKISDCANNILLLAIDRDTCPSQDNIIMNQQCTNCNYYNGFKIYNGQPCVECSYN